VRIAFVLLGDLSLTSGGFIYDRMLIERLRERGHEIELVQLSWGSYFGQLAANFARIAWPRPVSDYDLVLQDELAHPALTLCNAQLRALGVPVVALVHNLTWRQPRVRLRPLRWAVESAYLRGVDGALCVCEDTRRDVVHAMSRAASSAVVYAGRDHASVRVGAEQVVARAQESGPLRVAMLCNVAAHKGVHRMLAALRCPEAQAVELHVIGSLSDGRYAAEQRRFVSEYSLGARVHFHGELKGGELWTRLASAQVLALPSDREALPLAAIEALGAGLPVFVTALGGAAELIRDGVEGRVLEPDDIGSWAKALGELARDRRLLSEMGLAALRRYHAQGTWADAAEVAERFLLQIIARRSARQSRFR